MARVESFELDHNTVKAPYVRLAGTEQNGDALVENMTYVSYNQTKMPYQQAHYTRWNIC